MSTIKCSAAGDAMIFRELPGCYQGFEELKAFLNQADFRFVNLETTIHKQETYGAAWSGGSWFCSSPHVLDSIKSFGFNMLTTANNHAMDYCHAGLQKTLDYIEAAGLKTCGTGKSLADASAPQYLDTPGGRIAIIAACTTFHPDAMAGEQTRTMPGRPGLNGIRTTRHYRLPKQQIAQLSDIATSLHLNDENETSRKEGYLAPLPDNTYEFGDMILEESSSCSSYDRIHPKDLQRMKDSIREALFMSDYVVVAIHSHELKSEKKEEPADFLIELAHDCIDSGAHAVIGTGPHLLRPIEIYRGCPIFYCLGDFIIQLETITKAPNDMYEKEGLDGNEYLDTLFQTRSANGTRGLYYNPVMFETVVPYWEWSDGKLEKLHLMPVTLGFGKKRSSGGWPSPNYSAGILERLNKMSQAYGTGIDIRNGIGYVQL